MDKKLRKMLRVLACIPLVYACETTFVSAQNYQSVVTGNRSLPMATLDTMSGYRDNGEVIQAYVGQIIQSKDDRVLYQADNHDVADLVKAKNGKFAVKFIRPGRVVVTFLRNVAPGKFTATNYSFLVKERGQSSSTTGNYASNRMTGRTLVSADQLANRSLLHWNLTEEQYQQCYEAALKFAQPLAGVASRKEIIKQPAKNMGAYYHREVTYSMSAPHFLDAYGFFITKSASCQGAACAVGFVLNILGIDYSHVNHQKYRHQWCLVKVEDGTYWICDADGVYGGPECALYEGL